MQNNDLLFEPSYTSLIWDDSIGQWQNLELNLGEQIS